MNESFPQENAAANTGPHLCSTVDPSAASFSTLPPSDCQRWTTSLAKR